MIYVGSKFFFHGVYLPLKLNLCTELGVNFKDKRGKLLQLCIGFNFQFHFVINLIFVMNFNPVMLLRNYSW
jgi:hypothetical protein